MKMWPLLCSARVAGIVLLSLRLWTSVVSAADVKTCIVEKGIQYSQTSAATPTLDANNGVSFEATVKATGSNLVTSVGIQVPNASPTSVPQYAGDEFRLKKKYNKQSSLDANFPNGTYTLSINTVHDGGKTFALSLAGDRYPILPPRISNFPATQSLDAGAYFLFTWDPFTEGGADDFVQLHISDSLGNKVWETPDLGRLGSLDGRASSALVPPHTLAPGQSYAANLDFAKASQRDANSYPGALGAALYYKRSTFTIQTAPSSTQADVQLYMVGKSRRFEQVGSGAPTPAVSKTFNIDASVQATAAGAVTTASLVLPDARQQALTLQSDNITFQFSGDKLTQAGLDATYPDGSFTFQIGTAKGPKMPVLNLTGDAYPNAPHLLSLPSVVDPSADWVVSWAPFEGGTASDFSQLHIDDYLGNKVFETPDFGKSGAFNGTALGATVPRDTFAPGQTYTARVIFQKYLALDTTNYPGTLGVASYATRTTFTFSAGGGGGPTPPRLTALPLSGPGPFRVVVQGSPGGLVRTESSNDLLQWAPLSTNTLPASGQATVTDNLTGSFNSRFYRAAGVP
jgi:hypothetical protein